MLFNSHAFIFLFLPVTLLGFFGLARWLGERAALVWLLAASLLFYAWWSVPHLLLLLGSILVNHALGTAVLRMDDRRHGLRRGMVAAGIAGNLALLAWFKYKTFILGNVAALTGLEFSIHAVVLPLAISFFTFQQIAWLVDALKRETRSSGLLDYALFVTFFPQLIAGPIVHHRSLVPQFRQSFIFRFDHASFADGLAFFVFGLGKKLLVADPMQSLADPVFEGAAGHPPGLIDAWVGTGAFALGLYFDFSAYSDMAIGLARMFSIYVPYNFASPYKADSIIDFWRRWHITLSQFLRDYLYVPLGGNRKGPWRRYVNLFVTMLLGGLWHGASWNFVVWGGLHGAYLWINHLWRAGSARRGFELPVWAGRALTLLAVLMAWVCFRADSFGDAAAVWAGMFGAHGLLSEHFLAAMAAQVEAAGVPVSMSAASVIGLLLWTPVGTCVVALLACWAVLTCPNTQEMIDGPPRAGRSRPRWHWRPTAGWALAMSLFVVSSVMLMSDVREFVYFQF